MATNWKEKLAGLNRQYREIPLPSFDGSKTEVCYYRRPTEAEDHALREIMKETFDKIYESLKASEDDKQPSVFDRLLKDFNEMKVDKAIDRIVLSQLPTLRLAAIREGDLKEPGKDATEDDKQAFLGAFKPIFDRLIQEAKDEWTDTPHEVVANRAAESAIYDIASKQAQEKYRHCLIAQSIFSKDENGGFDHIYETPEEVPEWLDKDTIDFLATKIVGEIERFKGVPLN